MELFTEDMYNVPKDKRQLQLAIYYNRKTDEVVRMRKPPNRELIDEAFQLGGQPLG